LKHLDAGHWWLALVILATQESEIRRITYRSQPGQIALETLSQKNLSQKRDGSQKIGVAQGVGLEFKTQYHKNKKHLYVYVIYLLK
jgi:hypothetical protein